MISKRVVHWIDKNEEKIFNVFLNRDSQYNWSNDDEITKFVNIFHPSVNIEVVPFVLYSKLIYALASQALSTQRSFESFRGAGIKIAKFASLGDYARDVYEEELIDSIDWKYWEYKFEMEALLY